MVLDISKRTYRVSAIVKSLTTAGNIGSVCSVDRRAVFSSPSVSGRSENGRVTCSCVIDPISVKSSERFRACRRGGGEAVQIGSVEQSGVNRSQSKRCHYSESNNGRNSAVFLRCSALVHLKRYSRPIPTFFRGDLTEEQGFPDQDEAQAVSISTLLRWWGRKMSSGTKSCYFYCCGLHLQVRDKTKSLSKCREGHFFGSRPARHVLHPPSSSAAATAASVKTLCSHGDIFLVSVCFSRSHCRPDDYILHLVIGRPPPAPTARPLLTRGLPFFPPRHLTFCHAGSVMMRS